MILNDAGKKAVDFAEWGLQPHYKTVHWIKGVYQNRRLLTGTYNSIAGLYKEEPELFPGILSMDETIEGNMVVGYEPENSSVAQTTVSNMTTKLAGSFEAAALDAVL